MAERILLKGIKPPVVPECEEEVWVLLGGEFSENFPELLWELL